MSQELTDAERIVDVARRLEQFGLAVTKRCAKDLHEIAADIAARLERPTVTGFLFCGDDDKICGIDLDSAPEGFQPCDTVTVTINPAGPGGRE